MEYKLNLGDWSCTFAIPCSVVDKYISTADINQLRVLLWVLRHSERKIDAQKACIDLNLTLEDFSKSFSYWHKKGIFSIEVSQNLKESEVKSDFLESENVISAEFPKGSSVRYRRPDDLYVSSRIKESKEISLLMREAEIMLGRPISKVDSAVLIMLHDNEGLPVDVILMLIQYSTSIGKFNLRYIEQVGMGWATAGIDSVDKAETKIKSLNHTSFLWRRFQMLVGLDSRSYTSYEEKIITKWYDDWKLNDELIKYAYEICVDVKGKYAIRYIDGILKKWYAQKIHTVHQAKSFQESYRRQKPDVKAMEVSYDIEEYEKYSIFSNK